MEEMQGKDMVARWGGEEFLLVFPNQNEGDVEINITMTFGSLTF